MKGVCPGALERDWAWSLVGHLGELGAQGREGLKGRWGPERERLFSMEMEEFGFYPIGEGGCRVIQSGMCLDIPSIGNQMGRDLIN